MASTVSQPEEGNQTTLHIFLIPPPLVTILCSTQWMDYEEDILNVDNW